MRDASQAFAADAAHEARLGLDPWIRTDLPAPPVLEGLAWLKAVVMALFYAFWVTLSVRAMVG